MSDEAPTIKTVSRYDVVIESGDDGYFVAYVPELKTCISQGRTIDEAIENIMEAIELYLETES